MDFFTQNIHVDAVLSVDERGQMVLPKELRTKAGIAPGDKLALVSYEKEGKVCCIWLMKTEQLLGSVRASLGPLMSALAEESQNAGMEGTEQ